jgi:CheY-like chemotaxis protein
MVTQAKHIVLAEDNSADVMLVRLALKSSGINSQLHVLDDGDKAVAFIEEVEANPGARPIDLWLVDMHLPKRDGEEILTRLRSSERFARTPVVVMSASDAPSDVANAQKHSAKHYFRKPNNLAEYMKLGAIVRGILLPEQWAAP